MSMDVETESPSARVSPFSVIILSGLVAVLTAVFLWTQVISPGADIPAADAEFSAEELLADSEPTVSPKPARSVKVTVDDVSKFLAAFYSYTWQDSKTAVAARVARSGGVVGTPAGSPWFKDGTYEWCQREYCASEVLSVRNVKVSGGGEAEADITIRSSVAGSAQEYDAYCKLVVGEERRQGDGIFVDVWCPGGDG